MFQRLYDWTLRIAGHKHAMRGMAVVSFAESSFFPIPPDVVIVPMMLARKDQVWRIATVCTIASVLGGLFGYAIGYFLFESVGLLLISLYGLGEQMDQFQTWYAEWGTAIVLINGFTPLPYKLATIASGLAKFNLLIFVVASLATRGLRFFLIAALIHRFGAPVQGFIERRMTLIGWGSLILLLGGFAAVSLI